MKKQFKKRIQTAVRVFSCSLLFSAFASMVHADDSTCVVNAEEDRFEGFNRSVFAFNDTVDGFLLKPLAKGYRFVTPKFAETGVSNFFQNVSEVPNVINDVFQWKWKQAGNDTGRFLINTTIGIAGLFDVAQKMGLEESDGEDFGQTLASWGVCSGSYIVLPFLGPSTIRDTAALPVDWYTDPVTHIDHNQTRLSFSAADIIQIRAKLLETEKLISGDRYTFIRDAYLQNREHKVLDGEVEDDFGGGEDDYY